MAGGRRLWIDIQAAKADRNLAILVEVKGFENSPSSIEELSDTVGQYVVYQLAMQMKAIEMPLYLAVPETAYHGILSENLGQQVVQHVGMKILVFSPEHEEVILWLP